MMPDLAGETGGLFQRMMKYLGNMLKGCWDYITGSIGGSISGLFHRVFSESLPGILKVFFFESLPMAIFNTYLAIMSHFDSSAA
jgi:hypothetical protein